jgi:hypothetical protein
VNEVKGISLSIRLAAATAGTAATEATAATAAKSLKVIY